MSKKKGTQKRHERYSYFSFALSCQKRVAEKCVHGFCIYRLRVWMIFTCLSGHIFIHRMCRTDCRIRTNLLLNLLLALLLLFFFLNLSLILCAFSTLNVIKMCLLFDIILVRIYTVTWISQLSFMLKQIRIVSNHRYIRSIHVQALHSKICHWFSWKDFIFISIFFLSYFF